MKRSRVVGEHRRLPVDLEARQSAPAAELRSALETTTMRNIMLAIVLLAMAIPAAAGCDDGDSDPDCGVPTEPRGSGEERREEREDRGESSERDGGESAGDCEGVFR